MRLDELILRNFRNFADQQIDLPHRLTFVIGKNGQGKTNLLESVYVLGHGKSFRHAKTPELQRWGDSTLCSEVTGVFSTELGPKTITYQIENGKKIVLVNEKRVTKASDFYGQFRVIEFTPDDLMICKGSPLERRIFIDRILAMIDPLFVESAVYYERALKNRNAVIREMRRTGDLKRIQLRSWNELLSEHGVVVAARRALLIETLKDLYQERHAVLAQSGNESSDISYRSDFKRGQEIISAVEAYTLYEEAFDADLRRGKTTVGIQQDELEIFLSFSNSTDPKLARVVASQGQARSVVLALKLAALELVRRKSGESPMLLLDDVESELDAGRRLALKRLILDHQSQVLVTTTELDPIFVKEASDYSVLEVEGGKWQVR